MVLSLQLQSSTVLPTLESTPMVHNDPPGPSPSAAPSTMASAAPPRPQGTTIASTAPQVPAPGNIPLPVVVRILSPGHTREAVANLLWIGMVGDSGHCCFSLLGYSC